MPAHSYPCAPDFSDFYCHSGIDFIAVHSVVPLDVAALREMGTSVPTNPPGDHHYRHYAKLHDVTPRKLGKLVAACPSGELDSLECFLDLRPKVQDSSDAREAALSSIHRFMLTHIWPWDGDGIQVAARVSSGRGEAKILLPRGVVPMGSGTSFEIDRLPLIDETLYFGHANGWYADPDLPNFASVRLYVKRTDRGRVLPPHQHRVRIEVTLTADGCRHFGLRHLDQLYGFRFRRLCQYFRLVEPAVRPGVDSSTLERFPWLAAAAESAQRNTYEEFARVGAYTAIVIPHSRVGYGTGHRAGNRKIGEMFDNLRDQFQGKGSDSLSKSRSWPSLGEAA